MFPTEIKIRDVSIRPATILAPMAGVTDTVFRRVIRSLGGCGLIMTEFTSAEGLTRNSARTLHYLYFDLDEHPIAAQIFGSDPNVMASAVSMDKDAMKRLCRDRGLPVVEYGVVSRDEIADDAVRCELPFPLFVKPANLGSSVGIHKVKERSGLNSAFEDAFSYDRKVLVEAAVNAREIEVSVL